jgi:hypothetical protein
MSEEKSAATKATEEEQEAGFWQRRVYKDTWTIYRCVRLRLGEL